MDSHLPLDQYGGHHALDIHWLLYSCSSIFSAVRQYGRSKNGSFAMACVLCFGVVLRVYYAIAAKDAHNIVFNPKKDIPNLPSMMKYYLFMSNSHPDYGKYNPGQKAMYTGWLFMALIQIVTGFILNKPQVAFWANLGDYLGGDIAIRLVHLIVTWLFVLTVLAHVYLDVSEGVPVLKSMFTGKIRETSMGIKVLIKCLIPGRDE